MTLKTVNALVSIRLTKTTRERLTLVPLLALYLLVVHVAATPSLVNDEVGYVEYASRLAGHPSPAHDADPILGRLWWGPGYPLILVPFLVLKIPWIAAKYLNAGFLFGAIIYFYNLTRRYLPRPITLPATILLGIYPPLMRELPQLLTEPFVYLLICGFMFHFCALYNNAERRGVNLAAASLYLAYLAMTKVFFGYVIVTVLLLWLGCLLWRRTPSLRRASVVFLLAFVWCLPYLTYTYSLTGRMFYWGSSGGLNLYWMSTAYPNELGSWFGDSDVTTRRELAPHREFFETLQGLSAVERDDALKRKAIYNISQNPGKYATNWAANVGRLLFSYPYSFTPQTLRTYFFLLPNMFLVVLFVLSGIPAGLGPRRIPFEIWALLLFALIAIGGYTLLSADCRYFGPLVPVLWLWIGFIYVCVLRIDFRDKQDALPNRGSTGRALLPNDDEGSGKSNSSVCSRSVQT